MQFQVQAGAPGKKTSGAPNWRRKGREGRHAVSNESRDSRGKKRQGRQIDREMDERGTMQFQVQAGDPGRKRQGRQIDGKMDKRCAMQFQVQVGAPGKKNVRGAKLTEKRTRGVPCSFKCKQGLQGIKRQGRSIDGEKENKLLNCQTYFPFGLKIWNVVFVNSIIIILFFFIFQFFFLRFSCIPLHLGSAVLEIIGGKSSWYRLDKWKKK